MKRGAREELHGKANIGVGRLGAALHGLLAMIALGVVAGGYTVWGADLEPVSPEGARLGELLDSMNVEAHVRRAVRFYAHAVPL